MKFITLLFLFSCAHKTLTPTGSLRDQLVSDHTPVKGQVSKDKIHPTLKSQWMGKSWQLVEGGEMLQGTESATVSVTFKASADINEMQDLIAISVGAAAPSSTSRVSIRLNNGQLTGILRASDSDKAQEITTTGASVRSGQWQQVTLVIDYSKAQAGIYLDGQKLETAGQLKFPQAKTADTPSASIALGSEDDGSALFYKGEVGQVLIWRRALSPQEIRSL
jgi:hypothetical protein